MILPYTVERFRRQLRRTVGLTDQLHEDARQLLRDYRSGHIDARTATAKLRKSLENAQGTLDTELERLEEYATSVDSAQELAYAEHN